MTLEEYLKQVLPECDLPCDEGEENFKSWMELLQSGRPVILYGKERTGKSTLVQVLRNHGFTNVLDLDSSAKIYLTKQIPRDEMIPNFYRNIE